MEKRGFVLVYGDKVWGVATSVQQPKPMEKEPGQGFQAGGDQPALEEGKIALGAFRNIEEEIEFPIGWQFQIKETDLRRWEDLKMGGRGYIIGRESIKRHRNEQNVDNNNS